MTEQTEEPSEEKVPANPPAVNPQSLAAQLDEVLRTVKQLDERLRAVDRRTFLMPRELLTDIQALHQLLERFSPVASLPPIAGWALSPSAILALVDLVESQGARTVVECGSGTSTLWIAYALQRLRRGKVIAVEHLPEYAARTQALIDAHGLGWFAEVRVAPLVDLATPRGVFHWYDLEESTFPSPVDVLLVDGPPQSTGKHARYPALPALARYLAPNAQILCDDTERSDEQEMIRFWLEENPALRRVSTSAGYFQVLEFD